MVWMFYHFNIVSVGGLVGSLFCSSVSGGPCRPVRQFHERLQQRMRLLADKEQKWRLGEALRNLGDIQRLNLCLLTLVQLQSVSWAAEQASGLDDDAPYTGLRFISLRPELMT